MLLHGWSVSPTVCKIYPFSSWNFHISQYAYFRTGLSPPKQLSNLSIYLHFHCHNPRPSYNQNISHLDHQNNLLNDCLHLRYKRQGKWMGTCSRMRNRYLVFVWVRHTAPKTLGITEVVRVSSVC